MRPGPVDVLLPAVWQFTGCMEHPENLDLIQPGSHSIRDDVASFRHYQLPSSMNAACSSQCGVVCQPIYVAEYALHDNARSFGVVFCYVCSFVFEVL